LPKASNNAGKNDGNCAIRSSDESLPTSCEENKNYTISDPPTYT
jgi:hypothetical protein